MTATFVHLRVHTAYSLLEGALTIPHLTELAGSDSMAALAMTDRGNLFGALEFSEKIAAAGIQPIIGCTLALDFSDRTDCDDRSPTAREESIAGEIALFAKNEAGYRNLMVLSSKAYLDCGDGQQPHVTIQQLAAANDGLIALTGGPEGPVDRLLAEGNRARARDRLARLAEIFSDRLYVELQRHGLESERAVEGASIGLAYELELPIVATNQCYFAEPGDYEAHDALICIADGRYVAEDDRRRLTPSHCFRSQAEMAELFSDLPEAIENTIEVATRCAFRPRTHAPILPQFIAAGENTDREQILKAEADELSAQARAGLRARMTAHGPAEGCSEEDYWSRLEHELDIITRMKFPGYFLIVSDFIKWAKANAIAVGPGRGSGAGSVVAWSLTITDLDPLRFGLLFERFLNPERVSMPDFDIDFCQERRDEVIRYVQDKYGADRVAQIITYGKLQARAVLRDVGRVLHMPYPQVDRLCKLVPNNPANPVTLAEAIAGEPQLQQARDEDELVAKLLDIGRKLEGLYRHASTHAAGVVIGDRSLTELVPLYRDPRSTLPATQFNMKWVEAAGLVKFDFLGLKTLTVIERAVQLVRDQGHDLDLDAVPLDDVRTYEMLTKGETVGVFQLESTGMRDSLRRLKPDRFEDIIAMVALYRPGPMDNIPTYISRKRGEEEVDCLHPLLEPVLKETYGVIIYQEQVMQIAQILSGYSLGEADLLRRAMGKKIKAEMAQQRERFVKGALTNSIDEGQARYIFELVDKFAGYGFNKSHAAAYALLAYQTAYLKANYPVAFLAASLTYDMGNADKVAMFAQEAGRVGIEIRPPCINRSMPDFVPEEGDIRYALSALKNVGRASAEFIAGARSQGRGFASIADFADRLDCSAVNKRALEVMAAAGAFDALQSNRARVFANVDRIIGRAQQAASDQASGQDSLFGQAETEALQLRPAKPWPPMERLAREHDAIGLYLSGHPLDDYQDSFAELAVHSWQSFEAKAHEGLSSGRLAGIVVDARIRMSKNNNKFAFVMFSDQTGQFEAVVFSDVLAASQEHLEPGTPVLVGVEADLDGDSVKLRAQSITPLAKAVGERMRRLRVVVNGGTAPDHIAAALTGKGKGEVTLVARLPDAGREVELRLPGRYALSPAKASELRVLDGVLEVTST